MHQLIQAAKAKHVEELVRSNSCQPCIVIVTKHPVSMFVTVDKQYDIFNANKQDTLISDGRISI